VGLEANNAIGRDSRIGGFVWKGVTDEQKSSDVVRQAAGDAGLLISAAGSEKATG